MSGTTRSSDGLDFRRRQLLFRAWHRGMREMDLIMGRFADATVGQLTPDELAEFEQLMEAPDRELLAWITGEAGRAAGLRHRVVPTVARFQSPAGPAMMAWRAVPPNSSFQVAR